VDFRNLYTVLFLPWIGGTFMSIVTLASVVCLKLRLNLLTFAIGHPNYLYGLPQVTSCFGNPNTFGFLGFLHRQYTDIICSVPGKKRKKQADSSLILHCSGAPAFGPFSYFFKGGFHCPGFICFMLYLV